MIKSIPPKHEEINHKVERKNYQDDVDMVLRDRQYHTPNRELSAELRIIKNLKPAKHAEDKHVSPRPVCLRTQLNEGIFLHVVGAGLLVFLVSHGRHPCFCIIARTITPNTSVVFYSKKQSQISKSAGNNE